MCKQGIRHGAHRTARSSKRIIRWPNSTRGTASLGAPRYTLTAHGNLLFARIGSPVTSSVVESPFSPAAATLKWFDLAQQAALVKEVRRGRS